MTPRRRLVSAALLGAGLALPWLSCAPPPAPAGSPLPILRLADLLPAAGTSGLEPGLELSDIYRPVIPGARAIELPLPADASAWVQGSEGLTFETWLALRPEARRPGVTARFRVWIEDRGGRRTLLEREIDGEQDEPQEGSPEPDREGAWWRVAVPMTVDGAVDGTANAAVRIGLEVEIDEAGRTISPDAAVWGDPRIRAGRRPEGPNLLILAVDTLRADELGAWGNPDGLTPHLDALAARSVRLADLTAPAPWTLPSFATLLTGLPPEVHGAGRRLPSDLPGVADDGIAKLPPQVTTLAEVLSAAGFDTAGIYSNVYLRPTYGLQQGYDEYRGYRFSSRAEELVTRGVRWLEEHRDRRFFLFFHLLDPHTPYSPPEDFCRDVARRLVADPGRHRGCRVIRTDRQRDVPPADRAWAKALYDAEVAYTDAQLDRMLRAADELGLLDDTVILVVSDHGEGFWEHEETERRLGYQVVADHGNALYRELLHVPGLLSVPGWEPGAVDEPVELANLFPTLLELLGVEVPEPLRGALPGRVLAKDLAERQVAEGREPDAGQAASRIEALEPRVRIAGFLRYGPPRMSVRQGRWKLILPEGEGEAELYDLEADPAESHDLAGEVRDEGAHDERVAARIDSLRRALRRELRRRVESRRTLGIPDAAARATPSGEEVEGLEALGYGH